MSSQILSHAHKAATNLCSEEAIKELKKKADGDHAKLVWGQELHPLPSEHQIQPWQLPSPRKAPCMEHRSIPCNTLHVEGSFKLDTGLVSSSQPRVEHRGYTSSWAHQQSRATPPAVVHCCAQSSRAAGLPEQKGQAGTMWGAAFSAPPAVMP